MNVVVKRTLIGKAKKVVLEENEYEFCDGIWDIIKEFAGIYNYKIHWNRIKFKSHPYLIKQFFDLPVYSIKKFMSVPEEKIKEIVWNKVNKGEFKKKYNKKLFVEALFKNFGVWTLPLEYKVGDEIQFYRDEHANDQHQIAGVITDINKNRTSYKIFKYTRIEVGRKYDNYDRVTEWGWEEDLDNQPIINLIKKKEGVKGDLLIRSDKRIRKGISNYETTTYFN